jgi:hypothetical protein
MDREGNVQIVQRHLTVVALVDMPADQDGALSVGRWAEENAGACDIAIAALEIGSFE